MPDERAHRPLSTEKPDASPWSDHAPASLGVHWRGDRRFDSRARDPEVLPVLAAGYVGTVGAGAVFAASLVAIGALMSLFSPPQMHVVGTGRFFFGAAIAVVAGIVLAGIVGGVVFPLFAVLLTIAQ
jgi:hypothetical protein